METAPSRSRLTTWWDQRWSACTAPAWRTCVLLLALTVPGLPSTGSAQQQLVGVVTDRSTSAALPGVYVALEARAGEQTVAAALTDESGRFVLAADLGGTYRLRAERVGLATEVTEWFTFEAGTPRRQISMTERAVELQGLRVSARVRTCRLEAREAAVVQRWWDEVRKALRATALVEATNAAGLRFERFEREWTPDLRSLRDERYVPGVAWSRGRSCPKRPRSSQSGASYRGRRAHAGFWHPTRQCSFRSDSWQTTAWELREKERMSGARRVGAPASSGWRSSRFGGALPTFEVC